MPEGQAIHRLAQIITDHFAGSSVTATSPQGRFAAGAALIDGMRVGAAQAWGKHLFVPFLGEAVADPREAAASGQFGTVGQRDTLEPNDHAEAATRGHSHASPDTGAPAGHITLGQDGPIWLHVHLGLYGRWYFSGERAATIEGAGVRTRHHAVNVRDSEAVEGQRAVGDRRITDGPGTVHGRRRVDGPGTGRGRGSNVRLRLIAEGIDAELSGPHRCAAITGSEVRTILASLGPDPIRNADGDRERFVEAVRKRRVAIGQLVMDQAVVAGPGNIYRADCLWRVGISPLRPGNRVARKRLEALWDDLAETMSADVATGVIRTIPDEYRPIDTPEEDAELDRFIVYHRAGRRCLRCGAIIAQKELAGRRLFWCPGCQR